MFNYPPASHTSDLASRSTQMYHGYARANIRALQDLAKHKRFDISIGVQSALTSIYTAELVYYFVRLRHAAGTRPAAWRATIMFMLLIVDVVLIWLTVRSKGNAARALSSQQHLSGIATGSVYTHGPAAGGAQVGGPQVGGPQVGGAQVGGPNHENPFAEHHSQIGPSEGLYTPQPVHGSHNAHLHLPAYGESGRSHLNTPITH
ncbi:hypothetical protein GGI10_004391 [Coemansia sp. RSA 2530]|nr:hypothetical protein GGI06_001212 [Coemansia sp. S85]KAJ2411193.1 hypothetical protein GGI10_004391 [Coemansia sp. RSA 2530]